MNTIGVTLPAAPPSHYDVLLEPGLLDEAPRLLAQHAPAARYALISDANVAPLHGEPLRHAMEAAGLEVRLFVHPAGEAAKTRATWSTLTDALLAAGFGRDACVVALGGGVSCDLAGFVAATYLRGVPVVQVPTSLLAMVDAAVGGKTALDTAHGKNLVGAFHPPRLVLIDPLLLRTLPVAELRSGTAEMVKHGAIADVAHLEEIQALAPVLLDAGATDPERLAGLIERSVAIKAAVVGRDPWEQGERAALNFGHTLGHALERVLDYGIPHGHAVAVGMVLAARLGESCGVTERGTAGSLADALGTLGLPVSLPGDVAFDRLLEAAATDKKVRAGRLRFVLLERLGSVARDGASWTHEIEESALSAALSTV